MISDVWIQIWTTRIIVRRHDSINDDYRSLTGDLIMTTINLNRATIARIDELCFVIGKETGFEYDREEMINMALTAFEDVRNG